MAEPFEQDQTKLAPDADVYVVDPHTQKRGVIKRSELDTYLAHGYQLEGREATQEANTEKEYGDREWESAAQGAASVLTFGGSDVLLNELDPEGSREIRERSPNAYMGGMVGGAVLSGGTGIGKSITGAATRAGEATVARLGGEATLGARVAGAGVTGAVEGVAYSAGQSVAELAQSKDPLTIEGAAATFGSNALMGAGLGGGIGVGGKLLAEGAGAAKSYADRQLEAIRKGEGAVDRGAFPEVSKMDQKAASKAKRVAEEEAKAARAADITEGKAAHEVETTALKAERDTRAAAVHKEVEAYADSMAFVEGSSNQRAKVLGKQAMKVMKGADSPAAFVKTRGAEAMRGLQDQEAIFNRVLGDNADVMKNLDVHQTALLDSLPKPKPPVDLAREAMMGRGGRTAVEDAKVYLSKPQAELYREWRGIPEPKVGKGKSLAMEIGADELEAFRDAVQVGDVLAPEVRNVQVAEEMLGRNKALQAQIEELQAPLGSPKLKEIQDRIDIAKADAKPKTEYIRALEAHLEDLQTPSLGRAIAQGVGGLAGGSMGMAVGGPMAAVAGGFMGRAAGNATFDRFARKVLSSNARRGVALKATVAKMFAGTAERVAKTVPRASKIVPSIMYASRDHADRTLGPSKMQPAKDPLVNEFRQRARELDSTTERAPGGGFAARMTALQELHDQMLGAWHVAPDVANGIEKLQKLKLEYLAGKMPRDPTPPHLQAGPGTWEPSHAQIAKFARIMEVCESPEPAIERVANGTATPDDVETLRTIWPSHYNEVRNQCMQQIATLQKTLPYSTRLNLSILLDVPVDPALTPEALQVYARPKQPSSLQQQEQQSPSSKPLPMGAVEPTRAQRMSSK